MFVSRKQEWRVQRWDGRGWRQGCAKTREDAQAELHRRHTADPGLTLRVVCITRLVEAGDSVGPPATPSLTRE